MTGQTLLCVSLQLNQAHPRGSLWIKMIPGFVSTFVPWVLMCLCAFTTMKYFSVYIYSLKKTPNFGLLRKNIKGGNRNVKPPNPLLFSHLLPGFGLVLLFHLQERSFWVASSRFPWISFSSLRVSLWMPLGQGRREQTPQPGAGKIISKIRNSWLMLLLLGGSARSCWWAVNKTWKRP